MQKNSNDTYLNSNNDQDDEEWEEEIMYLESSKRKRVRPPYPYPYMIARILQGENRSLPYKEISTLLQNMHPDYYNDGIAPSWRQTLRFNLSHSSVFERVKEEYAAGSGGRGRKEVPWRITSWWNGVIDEFGLGVLKKEGRKLKEIKEKASSYNKMDIKRLLNPEGPESEGQVSSDVEDSKE